MYLYNPTHGVWMNGRSLSLNIVSFSHSLFLSLSPLGRGVELFLAPPPNQQHLARPTADPPLNRSLSLSLSLCILSIPSRSSSCTPNISISISINCVAAPLHSERHWNEYAIIDTWLLYNQHLICNRWFFYTICFPRRELFGGGREIFAEGILRIGVTEHEYNPSCWWKSFLALTPCSPSSPKLSIYYVIFFSKLLLWRNSAGEKACASSLPIVHRRHGGIWSRR